jgi:5'-phosphate synthase pdxT subunit
MAATKTVGVLALQGDFEAHRKALEHAGANVAEVRTAAQLDSIDGLIIPGGESTTMLKVLEYEKMFEPLHEFGLHKPIFGTCAGAILIARSVLNPVQMSLNLMDIEVERNAYGRQLDSRIVHLPLFGVDTEAVFIRAPIIRKTGPGVKVLATYLDEPVFAEEGRHMVATFHPELTPDSRVHRYFVEKL